MDKISTAAYYLKGIQLHYINILANLVSELSAKESSFIDHEIDEIIS